jgi:hypothetical protein
MALVHVQRPQCHRTGAVPYGEQASGPERHCCNSPDSQRTVFLRPELVDYI